MWSGKLGLDPLFPLLLRRFRALPRPVVNLNLWRSHRSVVYFIWVFIRRPTFRVVLPVKPRHGPRTIIPHLRPRRFYFRTSYLLFLRVLRARQLSRHFIIFPKMITTRSPGSGGDACTQYELCFFQMKTRRPRKTPAPFPVDRTDVAGV